MTVPSTVMTVVRVVKRRVLLFYQLIVRFLLVLWFRCGYGGGRVFNRVTSGVAGGGMAGSTDRSLSESTREPMIEAVDVDVADMAGRFA